MSKPQTGTLAVLALVSAVCLPLIAHARVRTPPCPFGTADLCRQTQEWMDIAAQAVFTALIAGQKCPGLVANFRLIASVIVQYGGYIRPEFYADVRDAILTKFDVDPTGSCRLAYSLYGPQGTTLVLGDRNQPVTGFVLSKPTGGFLDR